MKRLVITGTDTDIGKTVFAAGLTAALDATYWKPVQSGLAGKTDSETVAELSGRPTLPETYRLPLPASPHLSAEDAGVEIEIDRLTPPATTETLIIEGAGGLMVPLNRSTFYLDLFARWKAPVILVARTALGTINHTALSLMALRNAGCDVIGVAFVGTAEPAVEQTIVQMCKIPHLGRLEMITPLTSASLARAFKAIDLATIRKALG